MQGTGTEDYLNSSFYFATGPFGSPFAAAWDIAEDEAADPASGRVSACRWHVLGDAIDFESALEMTLEVGPGSRRPSIGIAPPRTTTSRRSRSTLGG